MTLLFIHVPKTAGTSFTAAARKYFGERSILLDYGAASDVTSPAVREFVYLKKDKSSLFDYIKKNKIEFLGGHFNGRKYSAFVPPEQTITFLRDPVKRLISHYQYSRARGQQDEFIDFVQQPKFANVQCRMLQNIDINRLGGLGVTEDYLGSLRTINRTFGIALPFKWNNKVAPGLKKFDVPQHLLDMIIEANQDDIALHALALQRNAASRRSPGGPAKRFLSILSAIGYAPK